MKDSAVTRLLPVLLTLAFAVICFSQPAHAQWTQKVLYELSGTNGGQPAGNLISDSAGNLYGVTGIGGDQNTSGCNPDYPGFQSYCGTVFKLSKAAGEWTGTVLHTFTGGADGGNPAAGLVLDSAGNLYGTAQFGGDCGYAYGCGVVYELSPSLGGEWTETVLYSFQGVSDGSSPASQLVFDSDGNLYGTAFGGGNGSCGLGIPCGVVFELSPNSNGMWTESVLYNFQGYDDGAEPSGPVVFDSHGNLYGTTSIGGSSAPPCGYPYFGCGTIWQLSPAAGGAWTKNTLHTFTGGASGGYPANGVIIDGTGTLFGAATSGGSRQLCGYASTVPGCGVIYALKQNSSGMWIGNVLWTFQRDSAGGQLPDGGLTLDASGNLYGTANAGGSKGKAGGVVFELSPTSSHTWNETVLYTFPGSGINGAAPVSSPIRNSAGDLIGTTRSGGTENETYCGGFCGVVYGVAPASR